MVAFLSVIPDQTCLLWLRYPGRDCQASDDLLLGQFKRKCQFQLDFLWYFTNGRRCRKTWLVLVSEMGAIVFLKTWEKANPGTRMQVVFDYGLDDYRGRPHFGLFPPRQLCTSKKLLVTQVAHLFRP